MLLLPLRARTLGAAVAVTLLLAAQSCSSAPVQSPYAQNDGSALPALVNESSDSTVFEAHLEARPTNKVYGAATVPNAWGYNGQVPGPLLDVTVGTRVLVHFKNSLAESTTIHWHGVRVPAPMDGAAMQTPIPPGGTFDYEFVVPDAGLFWYHPHVDSAVQAHHGLYGAIRVRGTNEPAADDEKILVLDDLSLSPSGTIDDTLDDMSKMMGRGGNTLLVNGNVNARLNFIPGATTRLRIVDAANGRFFNLKIPGTSLHVIGTDGGLISTPYDTDSLLVAPGERYDVLVRVPGAAGATTTLVDMPYNRGHDSGSDPPLTIATIQLAGEAVASPALLPVSQPGPTRLPTSAPTVPVELNEKLLPDGSFTFTINGASYPDVPTLQVPLGDGRIFDVTNASDMDHPFHLHGFFFQVLRRNGTPVPAAALANKDTIIVPAKSQLQLVARFDRPGMWMYHCHILEHAEGGMMGLLNVY